MPLTRNAAHVLLVFVFAFVFGCDCGNGDGLRSAETVLRVDPTSVDFGELSEGESGLRTIRLSNEGALPLALELSTAAPFSLLTSPDDLAVGESIDVEVRFAGGPAGSFGGKIELSHDAEDGPFQVALRATVIAGEPQCVAVVEPEEIVFDGFDTDEVEVVNEGSVDCTIERIEVVGGGFEVEAEAPLVVEADAEEAIEVVHVGGPGARATLRLWIGNKIHEVQLSAPVGGRRLCVTPQAIHFGTTGGDVRELLLEACGDSEVTVGRIDWTTASGEITLESTPILPLSLMPGAEQRLNVRYAPTDELADRAVLNIGSDDDLTPVIDVEITGRPDLVPEEVGRFLFFWQVRGDEESDIMRLPLQGGGASTAFWGNSTGEGCPGCHQVSPDGRYVAVVELDEEDLATTYVIDTMSNTRLPLADPAGSALGFSWRPDVGGAMPYRFAFAAEGRIHLGGLFDGYLGELSGANAADAGQAMPSWGSDGRIAFVRGELDEGGFGFYGPTDLYLVPESGGTATPIDGASANGRTSYYPAFSPNAAWIAFTESQTGETYSAADARVRLVRTDGSGTVLLLDPLNGMTGATSFPTWSVDGTHLSVSSNRLGGAGDWDIYVAPIDPLTGNAGPAINVTEANTDGFEHGAQWSP